MAVILPYLYLIDFINLIHAQVYLDLLYLVPPPTSSTVDTMVCNVWFCLAGLRVVWCTSCVVWKRKWVVWCHTEECCVCGGEFVVCDGCLAWKRRGLRCGKVEGCFMEETKMIEG
jgi:hypothetical protein